MKFKNIILYISLILFLGSCGSSSNSGTTTIIDNKSKVEDNTTYRLTANEASSFLQKASFGATIDTIKELREIGIEEWIDREFNKTIGTSHLYRTAQIAQNYDNNKFANATQNLASFNSTGDRFIRKAQDGAWWTDVMTGDDQLRQRVAFALSQIIVVSDIEPPLGNRAESLASFYDIFRNNAFGNYRDILEAIAVHPAMGVYLSHQGNRKTDVERHITPDENFAREVIQRFSVGLYKLNIDGTYQLNSRGNRVATYSQTDVEELSKVFTGFDLGTGSDAYGLCSKRVGNFVREMRFTSSEHEDGVKHILGSTIPAGLDGREEVKEAIGILFNQDNVAPYISKKLIMRLTSSNPSPEYVTRVASIFNDNGKGVKGDLKAVIKAILTDSSILNGDNFDGKLREPTIMYSSFLRAFNAVPLKTYNQDGIFFTKLELTHFGEEPLRAWSVFNFYSDDYIPNATTFSNAKKVSPEFQIVDEQTLLSKANHFYFLITSEYSNITKNGVTVEDYVKNRKDWQDNMMLNFQNEFDVIDEALDGVLNQNFYDIDKAENKEKAVRALIQHLDTLLLAGKMGSEFKEKLVLHLTGINYHRNSQSDEYNHKEEARLIISEAIYLIATSSYFAIQK
ncbi:hypothetical protein MNB_SV-15-1249 [hydrothermal vent metagenome]|uniref:DUF1800 domain-containing protein n=1 Tax=hydrothermal vent metagenome TaxID=652676 RepID=A0A1W1ELF9_9ZZZZ